MNKKKISKMLMVILVALIVWLIISNNIISKLGSNQPVQSVQFSSYESKDTVYFCIDKLLDAGDLQETVSICGWTFIENPGENSERKKAIILKSESECYELAFEDPKAAPAYNSYVYREDVEKAYEGKLTDGNVGFVSDFSTFNMKNGTYDVYIYCWENEDHYGITHTGQQFVKNGNSVVLQPWMSMAEEIPQTEPSESAVYSHLDVCKVENDMLILHGWGFVEEQDCSGQKIYISFDQGKTGYTTRQVARPEVAKGYKNEKYTQSGYQALIPVEDVLNTDLVVQILVEKDGQISLLKEVSLVTEENGKQYLGGMELPADRLSAVEAES